MNTYHYIEGCSFQVIIIDYLHKVLVDSIDFERVKQRDWYLCNGYAATGHNSLRMHHFILGLSDFSSTEVHHKNGNILDNRRCNLEVLTFSQHLSTRPAQSNNKSGYKGVSWKKGYGNRSDAWIAQISVNGKKIFLGRFLSKEEAAIAYDEAAKQHFGISAFLNFPKI